MLTPAQPIDGPRRPNTSGDAPESYPLAPLQLGMLFHSLDAHISGVDIEQITCTWAEPLDSQCFRQAWEQVVARHEILRTKFAFQTGSEARQEVCPDAELDFEQADWRGYSAEEQDARWEALLNDERQRGFDLSQLPLMRLKLVVIAAQRFKWLWTFHHILLDGRSFPIVLREVLAIYAALRERGKLGLSAGLWCVGGCGRCRPPPRPYRDFVDWLSAQDFARAEPYWRGLLKGLQAPPMLDLPRRALTRPAAPSQGVVETKLTAASSAALKNFATAHQLTVNTLLQAAWALLLHHYTGADDIIFGATRACRHSALDGARNGAKEMVGLLINTLPLRVQIHLDAPLIPWLRQLRDQQLALRDYEHTPLVKVQEWSDVPHGTALFESILVFENQSLDSMMHSDGHGNEQRRFEYRGQTNYPLTVIAYNDPCLLLRLEYDASRFDDDASHRLLDRLRTLLEGMAGDDKRKLGDVSLLSAAERHRAAADLRQAQTRSPHQRCLHEWFEAQVDRTPDAIAVTHNGQSLSYRELNRRANIVAHRLRAVGVGRDVLVGLCTERSFSLVIGMLAILKAGGAYLPLDPTYPRERLQFMLDDAGVQFLVTENESTVARDIGSLTTLVLNEGAFTVSAAHCAAENNLAGGATPDNLAYVIYTSGSTGKPKGVLVTHHNVARLFEATEPWFGFDSRDVWTLFHSYAFDFSVWEIWGALVYGGKLVIVPWDVSRSPEDFAELLKHERVTVLNQTPSAFRQLITPMIASVPAAEMPLRAVIFGGEALEFQSLQPWFQVYGDERPQLINMYGITETTVHVTYRRVVKADLNTGRSSIIGTPIPDLYVRLLNRHQQLVPVDVPGEICVGGAGVARGYLRRPELTAERFIADPFSTDPGAKLYRSGDLARWLRHGELEYLGRIDQQVKIRGFRIELGEIESALNQQPGVTEAAVVVREEAGGDKRLVAYFVANGEITSETLRAAILNRLPEHMVPAAFVRLEKLPLTANGKLDRKALPDIDLFPSKPKDHYQPPRSDRESMLCEIWRNVLGVSRVGVDDNFFALGGDSILCIQVITRARQAGCHLTTRDLFKHPTVAALAALPSETQTVTARPVRAEGEVALTPIQHWFFEQNLAELQHWNQAFVFQTSPDIELFTLQAALQQVVKHHDAFRLRFKKPAHAWQQSYVPELAPLVLRREDFSDLSKDEKAAALARLAAKLHGSLTLEEGPLLHAAHAAWDRRDSGRLLIVMHHLVVDGVSWRIFMEDLETVYRALCTNQKATLPAKTSSYQAWSKALREYAASDSVKDELDYWRRVAGRTAVGLPVDLDSSAANTESSAKTVSFRLNDEETRRLFQQAPKHLRARINEILLAALAQSLAGWAMNDSLLIDLESHGREEMTDNVDVSRTIGWFTAIAPVALDLSANPNLATSLRRSKSQLRAMPNHGLGYGMLRYLSGDDRVQAELAALPQAQIAFNYLGQVDQWLANSTLFRFAKESAGSWHSPHGRRRYEFEIICAVQDGCFEAHWSYSANHYRQATVAALAGQFADALRAYGACPEVVTERALVPEDFPLAALEPPVLDGLLAQYGPIEDLYPLTPMQKLFHAMDGAHGQLGFEQWHYILKGPLDTKFYKQAWERVVARHAVLRSAFAASGFREPLQLVLPSIVLPWNEDDWRHHTPSEQEAKLVALLQADRDQGLDTTRAPLLRFSLIRTGDDTYYFVWTTHHLLIDGWSWPALFQELSTVYKGLRNNSSGELPFTCAYRDYVEWLVRQPVAEAEQYWREELRGIARPTSFGLHHDVQSPVECTGFREEAARLSEATMSSLQGLARSQKLTLNTVVQGAWALLLSRRSGAQDVIFGAAYSGRPSELRGVEAMIGACVNNLPLRVRVDRDSPLSDFLAVLQAKQFAANQHQYCSLQDIQRWSEIPPRYRLFESLLVFQNYLIGSAAQYLDSEVEIHPIAVPETTNYPITVMLIPGRDLRIKVLFRAGEFANESIRRLLGELQLVLETMSANPHYSVGEVLDRLPELEARAPTPRRARPGNHPAPLSCDSQPPLTGKTEEQLAALWQNLFDLEQVDPNANFFDLGGHSVLLVQMHEQLQRITGRDVPVVKLFQYPTIRSLAKYLDSGHAAPSVDSPHNQIWQRAEKQKLVLGRHRPLLGR